MVLDGLPRADAQPWHAEFFSFFPAVIDDDLPEGFARPVLRPEGALKGRLTETLMMGLKPTTLADRNEAHAVWHEVVRQVQAQGCQLVSSPNLHNEDRLSSR